MLVRDRVIIVKVLVLKDVKFDDFNRFGYIFFLKYREGGVLKRVGYIEVFVDIVVLVGLDFVVVICEIVDDDGLMVRLFRFREFV